MKTAEIKDMVERQPFRPFAVRLTNGARYSFKTPRDVGATKNYHMIFFFGEEQAVRIDSDSIIEIFEGE